jgi:hypothetical protein
MLEHRFSYPIVHELHRERSDAPPAEGEPLAAPCKDQRELVVESLLRCPGRGSAPARR